MVVTKKKMSNTNADNVAKSFLHREISLNTEDLFMRESNILADNVAKNFVNRKVS